MWQVQVVRSTSVYVRSRGVGYTRKGEVTALETPCRPLIWGVVPVGAILKLRGRVVISIPTFDYVPFNVV